ncbi:MAG: ribonuclease HIII [Parachlamydiaceae bacterium]|nr:ribonuclease HIII [Parachlamydiaceae bacterium]
MSTPSNFIKIIDLKLATRMIEDLQSQGFSLTIPTPQYTLFLAKKSGITCTLYSSGKLMVQGKGMGEFIEFYLEPLLENFSFSYPNLKAATKKLQTTTADEVSEIPHIGIDESGKGDFFGPLCIAGVYADSAGIARLQALGVKDSKTINDANILKLAKSIRATCDHHIVKINPFKYNELYAQFKNLNTMLAWGHATVIEQLVAQTKCRNVTVDQFANERVVLTALKRKGLDLNLLQRHRAEEDVVVAAASILARETFLLGLEQLGKEYSLRLPKGASKATIEAGRDFVKKHGAQALCNVGKMHFKTTNSIL